jgi:hypothetical protein
MTISAASTSGLHAHHSPAKAARDLLQSRSDLANQPFGQIVSKLARGEDILPPAATSSQSPPAPTDTPTSTDTPTMPTDASTQGINVLA